MNNLTLYNIEQEHRQVLNEIEINGGEITPELEERFQFTELALQNKGASYGFIIKAYDKTIEEIDSEIERLKSLKKSVENTQGWLKARLQQAMEAFGIKEIKSATLRLSFRKSKSVVIDDENLLPAEFWNQPQPAPPTPDKNLIKKSIEAGGTVPGARVIEKNNLQIK